MMGGQAERMCTSAAPDWWEMMDGTLERMASNGEIPKGSDTEGMM